MQTSISVSTFHLAGPGLVQSGTNDVFLSFSRAFSSFIISFFFLFTSFCHVLHFSVFSVGTMPARRHTQTHTAPAFCLAGILSVGVLRNCDGCGAEGASATTNTCWDAHPCKGTPRSTPVKKFLHGLINHKIVL